VNMRWPYSCTRNNLRLRRQVKPGVSPLLGEVSDRRHDEVTKQGGNRQTVAVLVAPPKGITAAMMLAV
jgi:hypothetical protein